MGDKENTWVFLSVFILMVLLVLDFYLTVTNNKRYSKRLLRTFLCTIGYHKYRYYTRIIINNNRNCRLCIHCSKKQYRYVCGSSDIWRWKDYN